MIGKYRASVLVIGTVALGATFLTPFILGRSAVAAAPERVRFNEHIRPLLADRCFQCHGPDEKKREAELRLDVRDEAVRDRDGTRAIVPGKPASSELLKRIVSHDPDVMMPPPKAKKPPLTAADIDLFRQWIAEGAEYEGHWAFLPLRREAPPAVSDRAWPRNAIDQFILARLQRAGIKPSPEADRATLIRRLSLDLVGLLPSPEEVADFEKDTRPTAYEDLIERLLASPHYGERWGRHWLDQARYADSHGYSVDGEREMWPYRDWVIAAYNADIPFDRFTHEQLAGDLLPSPTKRQLAATAFHRNTLINQEGGSDREQFRTEAVIDRVSTTGAVWLGLTVGCAQCHSHKFDPIAQRDFYSLYAFFNSAEDANDAGPTLEVARGEMFGQKPATATKPPLLVGSPEWQRRLAAWEEAERKRGGDTAPPVAKVEWTPAKYEEYSTESNASFERLDDNSLLSDGRGSFNDNYQVVLSTKLKRVSALRLRVLTHESLPQQGPGRASNGNFLLTNVEVSVGGDVQKIAHAAADHEQPGFPAAAAIDDKEKSGWAINVGRGSQAKMNANHELTLVLEKPIEVSGRTLTVRLFHEMNQNYLIGRFAIDLAETAPAVKTGPGSELAAALAVAPKKRTANQSKLVAEAFAEADVGKTPPAKVGRLMVVRERVSPRETFLFTRGDFTRPDYKLGPLYPAVLPAVPPALPATKAKLSRLDLARWLVDPQNPLTPRVTINRAWLQYFGRGLVETEEDFGTQGTPPTHPELLDWLASEFIRRGWSLKEMHRLIVNSSTYRQSSRARPDLAEKDARNLLLARQERLRVDAEIVRDAALSASGLFAETIGGPSVRPPQPDGVFTFTQTAKKWVADTGSDRYRRGLYTFFYRSAPYPLLAAFDVPNLQTVCTRRSRSNTPLQSLTLANDAVFLEFAQGLAVRLVREVPGAALAKRTDRIHRAFLLCLGRPPSATEAKLATEFCARRQAEFTSTPATAARLLTPELKQLAPAEEGATLVCLARLLFNTDNFITRE